MKLTSAKHVEKPKCESVSSKCQNDCLKALALPSLWFQSALLPSPAGVENGRKGFKDRTGTKRSPAWDNSSGTVRHLRRETLSLQTIPLFHPDRYTKSPPMIEHVITSCLLFNRTFYHSDVLLSGGRGGLYIIPVLTKQWRRCWNT